MNKLLNRYSTWRFRRLFSDEAKNIRLHRNVKWSVDRSCVVKGNNHLVILGDNWTGLAPFESRLKLAESSSLIFEGPFSLYSGFLVTVNEGATLRLGGGYINYRATIECFSKITIGEDTIVGPDVTIRDSDNHKLSSSDSSVNQEVKIGNHCWLGARSMILKGVELGDNCVVAAGAVVTKSFPPNSLIAGVPAKVIREGINWE